MPKFILLLLLISTFKARGQSDSLLLEDNKLMKVYNYVTMAHTIETQIWKLKLLPLTTANSKIVTFDGTPLLFSFEKKIRNTLSFQIDLKTIIQSSDKQKFTVWDTFLNSNQTYSYVGKTTETSRTLFNAALGAELRYYYNMNRKMHRRHGSNNFSANYLAAHVGYNILQSGTDGRQTEEQSEQPFQDQNMHPFYDNHVSALYGIQRRFLRYFFMDAQLGAAYRYSSNAIRPEFITITKNTQGILLTETEKATRWAPVINFRIGFAF